MKKIIYIFLSSLLILQALFFGAGFLHGFVKDYNQGNSLYISEDFNAAVNSYSGVLNHNPDSFETLHNLGNSYYNIGIDPSLEDISQNQTREEFEKIADLIATAAVEGRQDPLPKYYYEKSIESYEAAIDIKQDPETQKNLEFVTQQLEKISQQEQAGESGEESEGEQSEESEQSQQESGSGSEQNSGSPEDQGEKSESEGLSEQTKEILEQRAQDLEAEQSQLQKYYNQNYQQSSNQSLFDKIFNNSLLENSGEKDW